jgi:hypothetical protein
MTRSFLPTHTSSYNASREVLPPHLPRFSTRSTPRMVTYELASSFTPAPATSSAAVGKPASSVSVIRLLPSEIAKCCKDGNCFHCDDLFTVSHRETRGEEHENLGNTPIAPRARCPCGSISSGRSKVLLQYRNYPELPAHQ